MPLVLGFVLEAAEAEAKAEAEVPADVEAETDEEAVAEIGERGGKVVANVGEGDDNAIGDETAAAFKVTMQNLHAVQRSHGQTRVNH